MESIHFHIPMYTNLANSCYPSDLSAQSYPSIFSNHSSTPILHPSKHPSHQFWDGGMRGAFEFAVPRRGAGVLDSVQKSMPYPESLPLLTSPPGSARTVVLSRAPDPRAFFWFFPFFSVLEKTVKKRTVKKSTFSGNFGDFGASDVDF